MDDFRVMKVLQPLHDLEDVLGSKRLINTLMKREVLLQAYIRHTGEGRRGGGRERERSF